MGNDCKLPQKPGGDFKNQEETPCRQIRKADVTVWHKEAMKVILLLNAFKANKNDVIIVLIFLKSQKANF